MRRLAEFVFGVTLVVLSTGASPSQRIAGLWEGTFHGGRRDQPLAFVCRPRGPSGFAGMAYLDGDEIGPIEAGLVRDDSVAFRVGTYSFAGRISAAEFAGELRVPNGRTHVIALHHATADTTTLPSSLHPPSPLAPAVPLAPDSVFRAHALPPDSISSVDPCLERGTLLLVGGGAGQPDLAARFVQLSRGTAARILDVPTATPDLTPGEAAARGAALARVFGVPHVTVLHTTSRDEANSEAFVKPLKTATGVWVEGGEAEALLHSYLGTRTEQELRAVLDRGGVVGGTSAGALIWGSRAMVFRARPGTKVWQVMKSEDLLIGDLHDSAIGLLRNVLIAPHFTEFKMQPAADRLAAAAPGLLIIGIDQETAFEVRGHTGTVLGRGAVTIYDGQHHGGRPEQVLHAGARYDIIARKVL